MKTDIEFQKLIVSSKLSTSLLPFSSELNTHSSRSPPATILKILNSKEEIEQNATGKRKRVDELTLIGKNIKAI